MSRDGKARGPEEEHTPSAGDELGHRVGLPQSHVSKIESSAVDLQLSSLIAIARELDLELTLIPRTLLPAVKALQRTSDEDR
jgi:transcriptional regulator with XRE-family HTH domain